MFSDSEQKHLNSFLNYLEKLDTTTEPSSSNQIEKDNKIPESSSSSKKKIDKKKSTTPYERKEKPGRARKLPHELLSEDQKKANHIASEQKRRANIRLGFDQLVDIVPGLDTYHRSEAYILQKSVDYIRELLEDKNELKQRARELQSILGTEQEDDSSEGELDLH